MELLKYLKIDKVKGTVNRPYIPVEVHDVNPIIKKVNELVDASNNSTGGILTKKVSLTNAELLALDITPIELIPAPGVGKVIICLSGFVKYNYGSTVFDNNMSCLIKNPSLPVNVLNSQLVIQVPTNTTAVDGIFIPNAPSNGSKDAIVENGGIEVISNTALLNGDGTLDIYLQYMILDI
jgi:hypothetical protein